MCYVPSIQYVIIISANIKYGVPLESRIFISVCSFYFDNQCLFRTIVGYRWSPVRVAKISIFLFYAVSPEFKSRC